VRNYIRRDLYTVIGLWTAELGNCKLALEELDRPKKLLPFRDTGIVQNSIFLQIAGRESIESTETRKSKLADLAICTTQRHTFERLITPTINQIDIKST
jgi:hypothetical protein